MNYSILVIDDDEPFHIYTKKLLEEEFTSYHARDAQEGVNILSQNSINLIVCDLHMPGLSGLELLKSLKKDGSKKQIPVLIVTNLPTIEKKEQALSSGAADIIDKSEVINNKNTLLDAIHLKLVTDLSLPAGTIDMSKKKNKLVSKLMKTAVKKDFNATAQVLCKQLKERFEVDYLSLWLMNGATLKLICSAGNVSPKNEENLAIAPEAINAIKTSRKPFLTNNVLSAEEGILKEFSQKNNLTSEIGAPLFSITERNLLMNEMHIPKEASIFGFVSLKRNKLFTTGEYNMISRLLMQAGSILWRLFSK
ncbi:response regulator [Fodinibius salsisoli]|uniref:Response regulator n=1 Tax=Fodinibius salsisoli TaxID=2820877 RepID=A0ABT3PR35_9BACT|nr:response regulator [Fodinibius salsisoli]MCW9708314.1 response regulator [Fodinibius salsisoli]